MADTKTYSNAEIAAKLRELLTQKMAKHESDLATLRAREQKLAKHELCPLCGGPDRNGVCNCLTGLHKNAVMGYGGPAPGGAGTEPMAMGEKRNVKKDEAGMGDVDGLSKHGFGGGLDTGHSSSASAQRAADPTTQKIFTGAAGNDTGMVNRELGGFKSLTGAHPAVAGGAPKVMGLPGIRKTLHAMGRPTVAVAGEIPNAKSEKTIPMTAAADERALPGTKKPKAAKTQAAKTGAGGEITEGSELRKDAGHPASYQKKPGMGVPGKQPVGQGGGDAHKVAPGAVPGAKPKLPGPGVTGKKPVPAGPMPASVDVDVSDFDAGKAAPAPAVKQMVHPNTAAARAKVGANPMTGVAPDALQATRDKMNLAADRKAGGVGFLNSLIAKFSPRNITGDVTGFENGQRTPVDTRPIQSKRFHGALPLRRSESPMFKMEELGKCAMCKSDEHVGMCKALSSANHTRNMLSVKK